MNQEQIIEKNINRMIERMQLLDEDELKEVGNIKPKKKDTRIRHRKGYMKAYYEEHKEDLLKRANKKYIHKKTILKTE
jgi:hypothetical protein